MLFNSFRFFLFFPIVFLLYWVLPFRFRKYMLLLASYYFFMCWDPEFIVLILLSTGIDYFCGLGIERYRANVRASKALLLTSMGMNLGLLFLFKYFNFFGEMLTALCRAISIPFSAPTLALVLPVGISFYTFQTMSYTIDVYRGKMKAERDLVSFALFVSYFPQLVAGPIEKATSLLPQLKKEKPFSYESATYGLKLMAWGFFKKLVIADRLAILLVDPVYNNLSAYSGGALLVATAVFAFQIYCDFGGYSDIARGCAKTMGIDLMVNFRAPYLAGSVTDFWKRWHISLTSWFREYVYIPLGGNRKGKRKKYLFIAVTFFLSGLWHGAAWTFLAWGLLQAAYLIIEDFLGVGKKSLVAVTSDGRHIATFKRFISRLVTFALCCFSWAFFRAASVSDAFYVIRYCLSGITSPLSYCKAVHRALFPGELLFAMVICTFLLLMLFDWANERWDAIELVSAWPVSIRWIVYVCFLLMLVLFIPKGITVPFLYFQF